MNTVSFEILDRGDPTEGDHITDEEWKRSVRKVIEYDRSELSGGLDADLNEFRNKSDLILIMTDKSEKDKNKRLKGYAYCSRKPCNFLKIFPSVYIRNGPAVLDIHLFCAARGFGPQLMLKIKKWMKKEGLGQIYLESVDYAIDFYKRQGFISLNKYIMYWSDPVGLTKPKKRKAIEVEKEEDQITILERREREASNSWINRVERLITREDVSDFEDIVIESDLLFVLKDKGDIEGFAFCKKKKDQSYYYEEELKLEDINFIDILEFGDVDKDLRLLATSEDDLLDAIQKWCSSSIYECIVAIVGNDQSGTAFKTQLFIDHQFVETKGYLDNSFMIWKK